MSEQHDERAAQEIPPDEDNSVLRAVEGRPEVQRATDPAAFDGAKLIDDRGPEIDDDAA